MSSPVPLLGPVLRSLLALLVACQPAAAAVLRTPARLQASTPGIGSAEVRFEAPGERLASSLSAVVPSAGSVALPAAPDIAGTVPAAFVPAAAPSAPALPSAADLPRTVSRDLTESLERGEAAVVEAGGRHFDGLKPGSPPVAAPELPGSELSGRGTPAAPSSLGAGLPESVPFHGIQLPAAQFSEEGPGWMSSKLRAAIDATQETLDLALLEVMHKDLLDAVVRARDRGVKVRLVVDSMHVYPEKPGQHRSAEIQRLIDDGFDMMVVRGRDKFGLMHNKFALMDGSLLWSGSANWSRAADTVHKENVTYTADSHRIAGFQEVWDWMYGLGKPFGQPAGRADGRTPPQDSRRPVDFHGTGLPAYAFGPGDEAEGWLLKAVSLAQKSLDIAMFSCTSSRIKAALLEARDRGVKIRFVFDRSQFRYLPPMMWFVENGFDVELSEGYRPGKSAMHHKFVIFDGKLVQNGSYNWTDGARYNNFENIQFFTEGAVVGLYRSAYEGLRKDSQPITDEDLAANRASAAERAREEAGRSDREPVFLKGSEVKGRTQPGPAGFRTDARRWMLSPFRRAALRDA